MRLGDAWKSARVCLDNRRTADARTLIEAVLPLSELHSIPAQAHKLMIMCKHALGVASHMELKMEEAAEQYASALGMCGQEVEDPEVLTFHKQILASLANCWQCPLNNTKRAAEYRLALLDLLGRARDDLECSICLEELSIDQPVWVMPCHHFFHLECIQRWHREIRASDPQLACPDCRQPCTEIESPISEFAHCVVDSPYKVAEYHSIYDLSPDTTGNQEAAQSDPGGAASEYQVAEYISIYSQPTEEARPTVWSSSSEYQVSEYQVQEYNPSTSDYQPAEYHIPEYIAHE
eukprot:CAMPEP_0114259924 /NCGR_PEP_ID=MMETSP0058-20121206/20169_1 /TAXON_ID=36894 /ORGANISM="Pyramimonas parkeae, CCMP726" /LENGTH=291 /DNA_ID=CAMNT_0001375037 /DNA_START=211 /DNA_END=1086 /DNA_ORIENTATION=+